MLNYFEFLNEALEESWKAFQNEPGYDNTLLTATITNEEINYLLDSDTGEPLDNGEVRMVSRTVDWPSYLFGRHLDQNHLAISTFFKNRKIMDERYEIPVFLINEINLLFRFIRKNLPPSSHHWEDFLNTQRDLIQNEFMEAVPNQRLETPLISFVTTIFDNEFQKEYEVIRSLDIASKKIKINLIKSEIATLFGLMLTSNIINNTDSIRLAKVLEAEFYTEKQGKGKKRLKPMNLASMEGAFRSFTSRASRRETAALNSKAKILRLLAKF